MPQIFVYSDKYCCDIGKHVFPVEKYHLLKEKLIAEKYAKESDFVEPKPVNYEELLLVHSKEYLNDFLNLKWTHKTMTSELPLTLEIAELFKLSVGGTILASDIVLKHKIGFHIGGGWHHSFPDYAEGFCYIHDVAIAIKKLLRDKKVKRIATMDCDLHQGNGTAYIFSNIAEVFTFSIHQENLYPVKQKSNLDIGLDDYTGDKIYLEKLEGAVDKIFSEFKPEFIFYIAGADPYENDQLGLLKLTIEGLKKRDEIILKKCWKEKIPVVVTLAGGYAINTNDTVTIHYNTALTSIELLNLQN
ncbi:MAG: histone deacetylase [Candidatus Firestonebacteria bacterium]